MSFVKNENISQQIVKCSVNYSAKVGFITTIQSFTTCSGFSEIISILVIANSYSCLVLFRSVRHIQVSPSLTNHSSVFHHVMRNWPITDQWTCPIARENLSITSRTLSKDLAADKESGNSNSARGDLCRLFTDEKGLLNIFDTTTSKQILSESGHFICAFNIFQVWVHDLDSQLLDCLNWFWKRWF